MTDYFDGALGSESCHQFNEHARRCPVCHETLGDFRNALAACRTLPHPPPPPAELEARILLRTIPDRTMTCEEFEEHLTDYLDGFLTAPLYHRFERHAALCSRCTDLPGGVVRSIGACYSYVKEEPPVPAGLHEKILQATLGTTAAQQMRAPLNARLTLHLHRWLEIFLSPQLATVATMLMVAVLVGTSTISEDGTIGGMYRTSRRLAATTYAQQASLTFSTEVKQIAKGWADFIGTTTTPPTNTPPATDNNAHESEND